MANPTRFVPADRTRPLVSALLLATLFLAAPPCAANPIFENLRACDSDGNVYLIYVTPSYWTGYLRCAVPVSAYGASDLAALNYSSSVFVQGQAGFAYLQNIASEDCAAQTGPVADDVDFTGIEFAGSTLYGIGPAGSPCSLYTVNATTGQTQALFSTGFTGLTGLTWHMSQTVFYSLLPTETGTDLIRIDLGTQSATRIGSTGVQYLLSLASTSAGLIAGSGLEDGGNLYVLNTTTGAATLIPSIDDPVGDFAGLTGMNYETPVPVRPASWGSVKGVYR